MRLRQLRRRLLARSQAYLAGLPGDPAVLEARLVIAVELAHAECRILRRAIRRAQRQCPGKAVPCPATPSAAPGACFPTPETKRPASETLGALPDACVHLRGEC